eukprot:PLAT6933.1.p1 GENE.PLAT6933.1~~PLAT6933.1.p1  ORF type:complete len:243 (+),score=97.91 PLAT6933.1:37-729(+)
MGRSKRGERSGGRGGGRGGSSRGRSRKKTQKGRTVRYVTSAEDIERREVVEEEERVARAARRAAAGDESFVREKEDGKEAAAAATSDEEGEELTEEELRDMRAAAARAREERKRRDVGKKAEEPRVRYKGVEGLIEVKSLNSGPRGGKAVKASALGASTERVPLSRREREELERQRKAAAYRAAHLRGETAEAKRDLSRLAEVRRRREEAKRRREAEAAAKEAAKADARR